MAIQAVEQVVEEQMVQDLVYVEAAPVSDLTADQNTSLLEAKTMGRLICTYPATSLSNHPLYTNRRLFDTICCNKIMQQNRRGRV